MFNDARDMVPLEFTVCVLKMLTDPDPKATLTPPKSVYSPEVERVTEDPYVKGERINMLAGMTYERP